LGGRKRGGVKRAHRERKRERFRASEKKGGGKVLHSRGRGSLQKKSRGDNRERKPTLTKSATGSRKRKPLPFPNSGTTSGADQRRG